MSEKLVRCFAHWERRGEAVSEGLHLVHGEWMCEPCFTGRPLPVRRDYDDEKKDGHCNPARDAHARTQARGRKRKSASRKWTVDYLLKCGDSRTAIEIESGSGYFKNPRGKVIPGGRHNRQKRVERDGLKCSTA